MSAAEVTAADPADGRWSWGREAPHDDGFYHPSSEAEVVALVRLAARRGCALRVRGAAHSVPSAIFTDARQGGRDGAVDVMLDRLAAVRFDDARMRVTVEAGCHLGLDPRDPTGMSTRGRSLVAQLELRGWALPDLGGVSHQTVAGFLMTGSCGGTVTHPIEDALIAVRWVDGLGVVREAVRDRDEWFDAVGCSMGLLGVVLSVTLRCVPRYDVVGREDIDAEGRGAYDLFADGGLEGFLRRTEYARLMWWPQRNVERVITWQARRMRAADYTPETGPAGSLRPKAYSVLGSSLPTPRLTRTASALAQRAGGVFLDAVFAGENAVGALRSRAPSLAGPLRAGWSRFARSAVAPVLRGYVPLSEGRPQRFWAPWHQALPMDDEMSEEAFPTSFTEIFVPLERAGEVVRALRRHFTAGGYEATGGYIFELYAARASRLWMHPSHGRDSLRVDVFWFDRNRGDRERFFEQYWRLLAPFDYRLHWGKHLPRDPALCARYLRSRLPRWDDFLALRRELDPAGTFLSRHWRSALGINP